MKTKFKIDKNKSFLCIVGISLILYSSVEITSCYNSSQNIQEISYDEDVTSEINSNNEESYKLFNKIKAMK